jgi:methylenetetrahydrofolate reductase (NADPH)
MTRIDARMRAGLCLSVELWPPRTPEATERLEHSLERLSTLDLAFASITYGAAGSTRERTHELVVRLQQGGRLTPMAHLTCAAHRRADLVEILSRYRAAGVENVLALRGDPPVGASAPLPAGELIHARELVELAREVGDFCVAVAAHPAIHPEATSRADDLDHLAAKLALADFAVTQFFFRVEDYLALVEALNRRGVDKPVVPGVMPITSATTLQRMEQLAGAPVPSSLAAAVERCGDDADAVRALGVDVATELCQKLLAEGAPGLHFYTMNQTRATIAVCAALGLAGGGGGD